MGYEGKPTGDILDWLRLEVVKKPCRAWDVPYATGLHSMTSHNWR